MTPRRGRPRRYRRPRPRCGADYLALLLTPRRSYVHAVGRWTDSPASALTVNVDRVDDTRRAVLGGRLLISLLLWT